MSTPMVTARRTGVGNTSVTRVMATEWPKWMAAEAPRKVIQAIA